MFNFGIGATRKSTKKKPCIQPSAVYKSGAAKSVKKAAPKAKKATTRKPSVAKSVMVVSEPAKGLNVAIVAAPAKAKAAPKSGVARKRRTDGFKSSSQKSRARSGEWLTYNTPLQSRCSTAGRKWKEEGGSAAAKALANCKWKGFDVTGRQRVLARGYNAVRAEKKARKAKK